MPRTIDEGFRDFLTKLTPSASETDAAKKHRASIEECLKANFGLLRFFRSGSFGHGTSIANFSDVDYFASIPVDELWKDSDYSLRKVKAALDTRFPNTGVCVRCPAVRVPFGYLDKETTEVVPAYYVEKIKSGQIVYGIANCNGAWRKSCPEGHNAYVTALNKKMTFKVKPLIRFIKAWKYYQNVPISSFYFELRVAHYLKTESAILYSWDVKRFFTWLDDNDLPSVQDPLGISGYIAPCTTDAQLDDAKSKLSTAATRAAKAIEAEQEEKISDAFYWWNLLYNKNFPSYYR